MKHLYLAIALLAATLAAGQESGEQPAPEPSKSQETSAPAKSEPAGETSVERVKPATPPKPLPRSEKPITLKGAGEGPIVIEDAEGNVEHVPQETLSDINQFKPDAISAQQERWRQRWEDAMLAWQAEQARQEAERAEEAVAAEQEGQEQEGAVEGPTEFVAEPLPYPKNWLTLDALDRRFPRFLVDEFGNPIPLPDPNPRKGLENPLLNLPDPRSGDVNFSNPRAIRQRQDEGSPGPLPPSERGSVSRPSERGDSTRPSARGNIASPSERGSLPRPSERGQLPPPSERGSSDEKGEDAPPSGPS